MSVERLHVATEDDLDAQELPAPRMGTVDENPDYAFAQALMNRPGDWVAYKDHPDRQKAQNDRARIKRGKRAFRHGGFEVATRKTRENPARWTVYVRYMPA